MSTAHSNLYYKFSTISLQNMTHNNYNEMHPLDRQKSEFTNAYQQIFMFLTKFLKNTYFTKVFFTLHSTTIRYLEYWLGSHLLGQSTFITGKLCNGLLSYILLIFLLSTRKCFWLFFRVTSLFIDNIKTTHTKISSA